MSTRQNVLYVWSAITKIASLSVPNEFFKFCTKSTWIYMSVIDVCTFEVFLFSCVTKCVLLWFCLEIEINRKFVLISDIEKIQVLCKLQILCAVLSITQQNPSKHTLCCMMKNKLDRVRCFPLYYDSKVMFFVLGFLFPLVIVMYFIFLIVYVTYFVVTLFTIFFYYCSDTKPDLVCVFNWPYRLCKNEHDCCDYCWCMKQRLHYLAVIVIICIFHVGQGWRLYFL